MSRISDRRRQSRADGFVLVATLWLLAAIAIGVAYFAEQVDRSRDLARLAQQQSEALIAMQSTRAEILFRLATQNFSVHGLGNDPATAVRLDDRAYRGAAGDIVQIQDNRGLVNLNFLERSLLLRFLAQLGVPAERQDALIDLLSDYVDSDNLRRLNGAEGPEYQALNLPGPANDFLTTPHELRSIMGWRSEPEIWKQRNLAQLVTTARVVGFDPNSAPLEVLASMPGSSREIAAAIVARRESGPLTSVDQWADLTGGVVPHEVNFLFFPSQSFRISQRAGRVPWMLQYCVTLTPASDVAPWRIEYHLKVPASPIPENDGQVPPLPSWPAAPEAESPTL